MTMETALPKKKAALKKTNMHPLKLQMSQNMKPAHKRSNQKQNQQNLLAL